MSEQINTEELNITPKKPFLGGVIPKKAIILISIIVLTALIISLLVTFKPKAQKQDTPETIIKVDVIEAQRQNYPLIVNANGIVEADTRGNLVAQIQGEIVAVSDQFKTGGSFKKGDVLLNIDDRDYVAEVSRSLASLSQAQASYQQEKANAKQAEKDWVRLGNTGQAPALVLRKPQLAAAKAQLDSAQAAYQTAQLNLSRTQIKAPYDGRIIRRAAALGQFVGMGTVLAETFATDVIEVKLPLSQYEYSQLGLDTIDLKKTPLNVTLSTRIGQTKTTWQAKLTRTDSTFDPTTRQINAVATVLNPFGDTLQPSLKIGQFVDATVHGRTAKDVFVLPNRSIREGNSIFVVRDDRLFKLPVDIIWQDDKNALTQSNLSDNELVVTTSLNGSVSGSKVKFSAPPKETAQPETKPEGKPEVAQPDPKTKKEVNPTPES